ncbi:MAG: hypothetical protein ABI323_03380, partial [Solirubrobacteraceae bacterium]
MRESAPINVVVWGRGDPAICVHGSLSWGTFAFREQRPLARMRALLLPDRRGYGASPPTPRADFDVDAADVAALLDGPTDLALTARSVRAARATMTERPPWEAELDLGALVQARRPTLVVSGRWDNLAAGEDALGHRAFTAVCEALTRALGAEHAVIDRWAHGCQCSGKPFNDALRTFWDSARPPRPPPRRGALLSSMPRLLPRP